MQGNTRTPLRELNLTDRFLFAETMDEPEAYQATVGIMEYINDTRPEVAEKSVSIRVRLIHKTVEKIRRSEKWGVKYMQRWEEIAYERQDAYDTGLNEGALREVITIVCKKLDKKKSVQEIADFLEEDVRLIRKIYDAAEKYAPEYDTEAIYQEIKPLLPCTCDRGKQ